MFGNSINYEKRGWKLTEDAQIEYRSHYNGWNCECPNNWLSATAENDKGETAKIWWYWPDSRHDLDGGDLVKDWSKCNDIQVVEE